MRGDVDEAQWPSVDVIIGNPPFLGGSKMLRELGDDYVHALRVEYDGRVPGGADLVTYWFENARAQIEAGKCQRAGLVATNSIRGGANQQVLARILNSPRPLAGEGQGERVMHIFNAWSDEEWINEGAAVRVSLVCFGSLSHRGRAEGGGALLDGKIVESIHADLSAGDGLNLTLAQPLKENAGVSFAGTKKYGAFDVSGELARQWLKHPNPNGRSNSDVVKPWFNGKDITARPSDTWIIDFGTDMTEADAALYETPFAHALTHVKPYRETVSLERTCNNWWLHERTRDSMREALKDLPRFIVTPQTAKYRLFSWLPKAVLPDQALIVIARADDTTFGVLHSRFHELWTLFLGTSLEDRPRYTPSFTFDTFPFPEGLTPNLAPADYSNLAVTEIATAAQALNTLRNNWLNPPEWTDWVRTAEEEKAGYPVRPVAKPGHEAELKKRTLTNLYNARPAWLDNAHKTLDAAVAKAYGWNDYTPEMADEEILRRLLVLNLARAG